MNSFPSSSVEAEWQEPAGMPSYLSTNLSQRFSQAANEALHTVEREARELFVTAEHTMEHICAELGIYPFHHNFFGNLVGCTLIVNTHGHLEIHREGAKHVTSFPVQLVAA